MKLLALDTSSEGCSAALLVDNSLVERVELAPRGHTRLVMPVIREPPAVHELVPADLAALPFAFCPGTRCGVGVATAGGRGGQGGD